MPQISVITPTNSVKWFGHATRSMLAQKETDWEWIVLFNDGAFAESTDPRIRCVRSQIGSQNVGALKREACMHATAPFVVEFDHDDELHVDCLAEVIAAFVHTEAAFVFSDDAQVRPSGKPCIYGKDYGWSCYPADFQMGLRKEKLIVHHRPMLLPQNVSRIWYAPDHVRAWRAKDYWACGGHDPALPVCDDLDLMARLWIHSKGAFHNIPRCLYKHIVHGENTWLKNQAVIQTMTLQMHDQNIEAMALAYWNGKKRCIDLGGGIDSPVGWEACDQQGGDVKADLNEPWPFADNSVGVFRAHDIIEHLRNPIHTMNEAYRSLTHGGLLLIEVPSTDGRGAFQDPTHVSFWNANSFLYWTNIQQNRYIQHAGAVGRFQLVRILDHFPSEWHKTNNIPYVRVHLAALKHGPRLHGVINI